ALLELGGGHLAPVLQVGDRLGAGGAQRVGLRLAAALGERLGEVGEDDGEPEPDRHGEREPRGLGAAAEGGIPEGLADPADRRDQRAYLDHEHHRVADLVAGIELLDAGPQRGDQQLAVEHGGASAVVVGHCWDSLSRATLSSSTFTPGSPRTPRARPSVFWPISWSTRSSGMPRTFEIRCAWIRAFAWEMS